MLKFLAKVSEITGAVNAPDISRSDRVYVMGAVLTLGGELLWGPSPDGDSVALRYYFTSIRL